MVWDISKLNDASNQDKAGNEVLVIFVIIIVYSWWT
jgi:hypothetical protein